MTLPELAEASAQLESTVHDFNRDSFPDLLHFTSIASDPPAKLIIVGGNGDGTFSPLSTIPLSQTSGIVGVESADFNRDGLMDLAAKVVSLSKQKEIRVLLGDGSGGFVPMAVLPALSSVAGDFLAGDRSQALAASFTRKPMPHAEGPCSAAKYAAGLRGS